MAFITIKFSENKKSLMVALIMSIGTLIITNIFMFTTIPLAIITSLIAFIIIVFGSVKGGGD